MKTVIAALVLIFSSSVWANIVQGVEDAAYVEENPQVMQYIVHEDDCSGLAQMTEGFVMARDEKSSKGAIYLSLMQPTFLARAGYRAMLPVILTTINDIYADRSITREVAYNKYFALCMESSNKAIPYYQ